MVKLQYYNMNNDANRRVGMFLWVRLVVDELKYCYSDVTLEETARSLPKGLKAAYETSATLQMLPFSIINKFIGTDVFSTGLWILVTLEMRGIWPFVF